MQKPIDGLGAQDPNEWDVDKRGAVNQKRLHGNKYIKILLVLLSCSQEMKEFNVSLLIANRKEVATIDVSILGARDTYRLNYGFRKLADD